MEYEDYTISFYPVYTEIGMGRLTEESAEALDMDMAWNQSAEEEQTKEENQNAEPALQSVVLEEKEVEDLYGTTSNVPVKAVYESTDESFALEYESQERGVKENILLKERTEKQEFVYEFHLNGLSVRKNPEDEGFSFYDKEAGILVGGIEAPNMNDATGEAYSDEITCEMTEKEGEEGTYLLTIRPSVSYLEDTQRVYPVAIDPTVNWTGDSKIYDVYTCNGSSYNNTNFYSSGVKVLSVGKSSSQGVYRSYLRFVGIDSEVKGKYVESATLSLYETGQCVKGETIQARRINADWQPAQITWKNSPAINSSTIDSFTTSGQEGTAKKLDLTKYVRKIARSEVTGYGIMLRAKEEGTSGKYTQFYNSRYATAGKRPKLTVVYYDAPTQATSLSTNATHFKKGSSVTVSWAGINSRALKRIEYRLVNHDDATGTNGSNVIPYSTSTKIGTTSSGTAVIPNSNTWDEGCYAIGIRGVDQSDITGKGKYKAIHIDSTAPTLASASISPTGYTGTQTPVLSWSQAGDKHFQKVQYQVGDHAYVDAGTTSSGSVTLPASYFPNTGTYTIRVRAVDKVGNTSAVKTLNYYLDKSAPVIGSLSMNPEAGRWTTNTNPLISFTNISEGQSGLNTSRVEYSMVAEGSGAGTYKNAANVSYTSVVNPWAGSFRVDSSDQARADGAYTIYIRFWDKAGNASLSQLSYKKDTTAPTGTINCSLPNDNLHDTIQITTDLTDGVGSGIKNSSLVLKDASGTTVSTIYNNFTTTSVTRPFNTRNLRNGAYKLELTVTDNVNLVRTVETAVSIKNQLEPPIVTGSNTNDGTATVTWEQEVGKTPLQVIQYKRPGKNEWQIVSRSDKGSVTFPINTSGQTHTVWVRGVDVDGLVGKEASVVCIHDSVKPQTVISSMSQGVMKGTVTDDYLNRWIIEVKEKGQSSSSYQEIANGTSHVQDGVLTIVEISSLNYVLGHTYEFRLTAWDKAGNSSSAVYEYTKNIDDSGAELIQPVSSILWPEYDKAEEGTRHQIPLNTNYFELQVDQADPGEQITWYIDNQKVSEQNQNSSRKNVLDFHKIKDNYEEGMDYSIIAERKDSKGDITYSVPMIKRAVSQNLIEEPYSGFNTEIKDGKVAIVVDRNPGRYEKTLNFSSPLVSFRIKAEGPNMGVVQITYSVKTGESQWKVIELGKEYKISQLFPGHLTVKDLTIEANMIGSSMKIPELTKFHFEGDTLSEESFHLSEMENYTPQFVSAVSKINYKTYLNWSRRKEKDISDFSKEKEVEVPENVSYEIYRATDKETLKRMTKPTVEGIQNDYFSEININYSQAFYYRIRAVRTKVNPSTGKTEKDYSRYSPIFFTKVVDGDEYVKFLGDKPYWSYVDFSTPNGSGAVEKSRGNFTYTQTDAEIPNENLEVTLDRTYNNQASTVSSLGQGWNHSYDLELLNINEQDRLIDRKAVKDETGTIFLFEKVSNGAYASSMGKYITLKAESKKEHITVPAKNGNPQIDTNLESSYTMRTKDNLEYRFNEGGQLIYVTEPNKSFVFLQYDGKTGRLQKAITNQNLMTTFIYADGALEKANAYVQQGQEQVEELEKEGRGDGAQESENSGIDMDQVAIQPVSRGDVTSTVSEAVTNLALVRSVILPDGTGVDYEYDNQNQLTSVVRKSGEQKVTYQYEYDKKGNLSVIYDAKGNPYKLSYKEGKVSEVFYPEIHNDTESVKFTYREIQEGESVYETVIQRGINGSYGLEELVKSSLSGNTLYTKDENGVESTYTYEDNLLKTTNMKSEYQVIENGKVVTKEGVRTSNTTYDENLNMNPVLDIDEDHNETAYEYEEQSSDILDDLPTRVTDTSEGKHISDCEYTYDAYGNEIEELDHVTGDSVQCTYYGPESEFSGNLKREVEKTRVVSESGEVSYAVTTRDYQYTYQAATGVMEEKVVEVTGDKSVTSISRYDRMGNLVYEDDGLGNISSFTYDYLGRLTGASYSEGGILSEISRVYDANGTLIREVEKDGTVTVYTHDARNQMVKKVLSKGSMSRTYLTEYGFEWRDRENGKKELVSIVQNTSPEGQISKDYGNQLGWNIETVSNGLRVKIEYDKHGEAVLVRTGAADGTGKENVSMTLYDNAGNAWAQVVNPVSEGGEWLIGDETVVNQDTFDARGNRTSATDGMGNTMTYTYDELSRLTEVSAGKDSSKTKLMQYSYDIYEEDGTISSKSVDANGNVSKEYVDWEGNTVRNADQGNGKIQAIATGYQYDKKGNVIKETYTNGDYKAYEYDGRNRLVQVTWYKADGTGTLQTKYTYSTSDQVLTMEDFRVEGSAKNRYRYTAYEYDDMNQLTAQAEYDGSEIPTKDQIRERQTKYAYDKDGKLLEVTYSKTENGVVSLQYQYNEYGWLSKVKAKLDNRDSSTLREYLYNSDGKICEIRDYPEFAVNPSGHYMSKRYEFDDLMRVTHMEYRSSLQPDRIRESYDYAYDKNSNIISESIKNDWSIGAEGRANEVRTHTYDARGRLVFTEIQDRLKNESKIVTYTYDSVGNRLSEWDGATQTSYTYNSLNQMTGSEKNVTGNVTSQTAFVYDPNGNLIKETDSVKNRETTYTYDVENRLDQVTVKSNGSTALDQKNVYNGEGQRIQKTENGSVTKYYYQNGAVQHTTDGEGNKTSFHLLGLENQVIMSGRYDGAYAGKYYQYNRDIRGSITDILDQEDNCQVSYKYSDFGETQRYGVQDFYNEICYSGGIYDESTELYYLNARYYDPESGRFLSQDTYRGETDEEETWNLYAYCANNPVKYVDPSGHELITIIFTTVYAVGAICVVAGVSYTVVKVTEAARGYGGVRRFSHTLQSLIPQSFEPKKTTMSSYLTGEKTNKGNGGYAAVSQQSVTTTPKTNPMAGSNTKTTPKVKIKRRGNSKPKKKSLEKPQGVKKKSIKNRTLKSKGGKQNKKDSGFRGLSDQEISRLARDKSLTKKERRRFATEEKARKKRNARKNRTNAHSK